MWSTKARYTMLFKKNSVLFWAATGLLMLATPPVGAWYRGDEYEQRSFNVDAEYYVDVLPILPNIEERWSWWKATNAFIGGAGSYTRRNLFNQQRLKLEKNLDSPFSFQFDFVTDQDFDGIYQHYLLGLDYAMGDAWSMALVGEPLARKEYADIGAAVRRRVGGSRLDLMALLPNFSFDRKNEFNGTIERKPVNFQVNIFQEHSKHVQMFLQADVDFPSRISYAWPEFDFEYESWKPSAGLVWNKAEDEIIWCEWGAEYTDKERRSFSGMAPEDFRSVRNVRQARVEYVRYPATRHRSSLGAKYVYLRERNDWPNKPEKPELLHDLSHTTRMLYGMVRRPLGSAFYAETGVILDYVSHTETYPRNPEKTVSDSSGFEGKVPFSIGWQGTSYRFDAGLSVQLDALAFGGGYMTGMVVF